MTLIPSNPMNIQLRLTALVVAAAFLTPASVLAGEGHNHDAAPAAAGPALPRFAAVSETFELVGVVNGRQLALYLDRFADNSPVKGARIELEVGGAKVDVRPHAEGEYEATLAQALQPGVVAVTATVTAGSETDLLAGELDLHEDAHAEEAHVHGWQEIVGWGAAGLAAMAAMAALSWLGLRAVRARRSRIGGAA